MSKQKVSPLIRTKSYLNKACVALSCGTLLVACGGGSSGDPYQPPSLSDGVIFTYPIDGQTDVPVGTRFYVTFSKGASQSAVDAACSVSGGDVTGNFCLIGPGDTVVPITATVNGKVVSFESNQLQQGTDYSLYVRSAVIGGGSTNLSSTDALINFKTTQYDSISGVVPSVVAINGENPGVYAATPIATARYPFMDFSTIRVEFSEPLDEKTVQAGSTFQFIDVTNGNTAVPGAIMARKHHVSFDPTDDLDPTHTYQLILSNGILDRNGESLVDVTFDMTPSDSNTCNCVIDQTFNTTTAYGEAGFPQTSLITGAPLNAIDLYSPLIGTNDINLRDSTLQAELADPAEFGGLIPFVIRKGGYLNITGLDLRLGGEVPANLQTGDITASFINDVTGFMDRSPFRAANVSPDDNKAPVFVYLMFDLALTGSDATGNAVLNQTIPHVQATGTARVENGNLYIESVRTLEMDLLGLDRAPAHMVLGINSDLSATAPDDIVAPMITAAFPADGSDDFLARDEISLIFSEPMANDDAAPSQITLTDITSGSTPVAFQLAWDGSTILVKPNTPLTYGNQYQISVGALTDLAGNALSLDVADATGGDGNIVFTAEDPDISTTVGPMVNSVHVGAACDLTGSTYAAPGRCVGGNSGDDVYASSDMPEDARIEVTFNQPMNLNTLALGTACGSGAIRVEELDGDGGSCVGVVAGSLVAESRGFKFTPSSNWTVGTYYRLTMVAGGNTSCDANEICGENNRPLNTDPLNGAQSGDAGGGAITNVFQVVAANDDILLPLKLEQFTDQNGNGFVDAGETGRVENSAGVGIVDLDLDGLNNGIITSAAFLDAVGGNPVTETNIYLSGSLPVTVGQPEPITIDGSLWGMTLAGTTQIPVRVHPGILYGTSIVMESSAEVLGIGIPISDVETGMSILRVREGGAPVYGYIVEEEGVAEPQFIAQLDLYMDAPDMEIEVNIPLLGGLIAVNHNLHSMPLTALVKGPITTLDDGRIQIEQSNITEIELVVNVTSIAGNGAIKMLIGAGGMQLKLIGNPLKGRN